MLKTSQRETRCFLYVLRMVEETFIFTADTQKMQWDGVSKAIKYDDDDVGIFRLNFNWTQNGGCDNECIKSMNAAYKTMRLWW